MRSLTTLIVFLISSAPALAAQQHDPPRPNILLITADDMNFDSLGCFGNTLPGVTPNLDKLASKGVRFEHAYVTIAICMPGRAAIMTGRYPHTSGALGFDKINQDVPTLPETLKANGYYNACIGKAVHTVPSRHKTAFDETYDMADLGQGRSPKRYRETVTGAIAKAKQLNKPFLLNVNTHDPHRPFANAPQENRDRNPKRWAEVPLVENPYKPEEIDVPGFLPDLPEVRLEMAEYYTSVRRADQIIGEVLKVLDESGQADNTVVLFLSDHGLPVPFAKTNCYMHSNRTPLIIRWPGKTKAGAVVEDKMVSSIDLAPTILDIVGLENLEGANGQSFRGLIDTNVSANGVGRDWVFVHLNYPFSRKSFTMRGIIRKYGDEFYGYTWNGWADGETKFANESMSGRTFTAMQKAAKDDPAIAERVKHYLHRTPEEFYDYAEDADALDNRMDAERGRIKYCWMSFTLLHHMRDTNDPQFDAYYAYLKSVDARAIKHFKNKSVPAEN